MGRVLSVADIAQFGVGEPNEYGRFPRYVYPKWWRQQQQPVTQPGKDKGSVDISVTTLWRTVFARWDELVGPDLHEVYGLDDCAPDFWDRPWRSTLFRIRGLLARPDTRLARALVGPRT